MTDLLPITILIAARNEEANISKCIEALGEFERIIVLDSSSSDRTACFAEELGAEVVNFQYRGGYPKKRQWAMETLEIKSPWTLLLDADEVVTSKFVAQVRRIIDDANSDDGYLVEKGFHFLGRKFRFGGFSHSAVLLFKTGKARFEHLIDESQNALDMEVHERIIVDGTVGRISAPLIHEDFKGLEAYISRHNKYSTWEASVRQQHLSNKQWGTAAIKPRLLGNTQERRRYLKQIAVRLPFEHWLWFAYHFVLRLGFLEGRRGLIASQIRSNYIAQSRAKVFELRLANSEDRERLPFQPTENPTFDERRKAA